MVSEEVGNKLVHFLYFVDAGVRSTIFLSAFVELFQETALCAKKNYIFHAKDIHLEYSSLLRRIPALSAAAASTFPLLSSLRNRLFSWRMSTLRFDFSASDDRSRSFVGRERRLRREKWRIPGVGADGRCHFVWLSRALDGDEGAGVDETDPKNIDDVTFDGDDGVQHSRRLKSASIGLNSYADFRFYHAGG